MNLGMLFLAIFLLIFGILNVSNIEIVWSRPIMGFSALLAGVFILIPVVMGYRSPPPPPQ